MEKGKEARNRIFGLVSQLATKNRDISKQITQSLKGLKFSTSEPGFLHRCGIGIWVESERQRDGNFRVEVALRDLSPSAAKLDAFYLELVTSDREHITGIRQGRRMVFENVPPGEFSIENWSLSAQLERAAKPKFVAVAAAVPEFKHAVIWDFQQLKKQIQSGIADFKESAKSAIAQAGEWLQPLLMPEPQPALVTVGPAMRTRSGFRQIFQTPTVEARILDESGNPTGQTLPLVVERAPQITRGQFRVTLSTSALEYEGYTLQMALQNENGRLELCSIHFRKRDEKLIATALVPISDMFAVEEGQVPSGYIPIELLDITLQAVPQEVK